ncbi:hypothetical protein QQP08_020073 [Theobroma cacao]|nr:hypothetical protein QQP08_020073 [Theobroma cacao]
MGVPPPTKSSCLKFIRGSITGLDWAEDANSFPTSAKEFFGTDLAQVHSDFLFIYTGKVADSLYSKTNARDQECQGSVTQVSLIIYAFDLTY